jgi:hypothetical protein
MRWMDLRARILMAVGLGGAALACGGSDAVPSPASDAGADAGADAAADGSSGDASDASPPFDAATDSPPSVRRPFLVGRSLRKSELTDRGDWLPPRPLPSARGLDSTTARALARDWLRDAAEEHASIAAFARFTLHLLSVGAPPDLVLASQKAARDEVRHAEACFALARRYGGKSLGPAPLSLDGAMTPMDLADIAALTAEEGCVGETLGALLAEELLSRDLDPVVHSTLARANLAADEARHAELAWSFVAWAVKRGGDPVRRAVAGAIARAVEHTLAMPVRAHEGIDLAAWRAHGRFTCADARAIARGGVENLIEPATATLLGRRRRHESSAQTADRSLRLA